MKCLKILFILAMLMALITTLSATSRKEGLKIDSQERPTSLHGTSRFVAQTWQPWRATMTCDKYPMLCGAKGSPWPDCCNKMCVNVLTDWLNCGMCGKMCKYSEICCEGKCVNPWNNKKHCGFCNNKCKKGSSCGYGMCSYA